MRTLLALFLTASLAVAQEVRHDDLDTSLEAIFDRVSEKVGPCVVSIEIDREKETSKRSSGGGLGAMMDGGVFKNRPTHAPVSGTILDPDGWIATSYFNVSGKIRSIQVTLSDGRTFDGTLKGFNATYDIALIKIDAKDLPTMKKATLTTLKTGQMTMALGRSPDGKSLTLNPGMVSAAWRLAGRGIQVDSHLNYGNVGGPLVNREGQWIAITCKVDTKYAGSYGQNSGVGFAVTWDKLEEILPDLKLGKTVSENRKPFLGIQANVESDVEGALVDFVQPGTAAERAGIKAGDIIIEFDGTAIKNFDELKAVIARKQAGDKVKFKLLRSGEELSIEAELGWRLDD